MQLELSLEPSGPDARTHDPSSSHLAVRRVRTNKGLAKLALEAIRDAFIVNGGQPVSDDDLLDRAERISGKRQQRNVLAKVRGVLEENGYVQRVPSTDRVRYIPIEKDS
jgi:hypothetical protein